MTRVRSCSTDAPSPLLDARGLTRLFDTSVGVRGLDVAVATGEVHALVGLNGAGKTTLMRLLLGMLHPDSGTVRLQGRDIKGINAATWASVGHLVDQPFAYPELDVRSNLTVAARLRGVPKARVANTVERVIAELELERYARTRARVLSRGNLQRVGLGCALQHDPGLIILDEPTTALDPKGVILLRESLLRRAAAGAAILVSSHHLDEVARIASRITVINRGRIVGTLDPRGVDIERAFFALVEHDELDHAQ